jgi:hypothetical protein
MKIFLKKGKQNHIYSQFLKRFDKNYTRRSLSFYKLRQGRQLKGHLEA